MSPWVPYASSGLNGDIPVDSRYLEAYHYQVDEIVLKVDDLAQKLKEIEQFYSATNKKEQNTSKLNSIFKDKDKDKIIANLKKRQQDAPQKEEAATKRMMGLMRQFSTIISQITSQHKWAIPFMKPVDVVGLGLHDYHKLDEIDMHLEELKGLVLQNYRKMTTEEKRRLATSLTRLPAEDLNEALLIVAEDNPCFQANATEVDLDIDSQGELTLWKLKFFLKDKLAAAAAAAGRKDNSNHNNNGNNSNTNNNNNSKPVAAKNNHNNMNKRKREICDAIAQNLQKKAKETTSQQVHNPRK